MSDSVAVCAKLAADGEGLELFVPCYVVQHERVKACMGTMERIRECFPDAVEGAGLVALPWYEGIEQHMESVNLQPLGDAAGYMPGGHCLSVLGVRIRTKDGSVVALRKDKHRI